MKNEYLYFVDFGLEHITLLVCKLTDNRLTEVPLLLTQKIEISSHRPQNVFSQIENFDYLVKLITKAEKQLNKDINEIIFLSKNDAFEIFFTTCKIEFKKAQKILQSHKEKLSTQVLKMFYEKTNYLCTILDLLCNNFILDDNIEIKNPYKMSCKKIILNSTIISIKNSFFKNFSVFLERYKIHMKHYISPCIATYNLMQYNLPQKGNFLFIDIGSCNTEYCIVMNRCVTFLDKVNLGGLDMTRDIATELKIYIRDADKVKQKIARTDIQNTKNTNTKLVVNQVEQIANARLNEIIQYQNGIILVTGPTGSGKSTTIASLINNINENSAKHIITIEDPVEYIYNCKKSIVSQRQIGVDTASFSDGIKYALRQDPDVIFIGEIRDKETMSAALKAAETGHLVLTTLHTNDAVQTINRIVNMFEESNRSIVRKQLSETLRATIAQKLVYSEALNKRFPVCEILVSTPTIKDYISKGVTEEIYELISENNVDNMVSMNSSLALLVSQGKITQEEALETSNDENELEKLFRGVYQGTKNYYE